APLPRRVGRIARAGPRPPDHVGRALRALHRPHLDAVPFAMENPEKGIAERSDTKVRWISNTTGDDDGVDLTLDAPDTAVLAFRTPVLSLDVRLGDLAAGDTRTFPAGGVDLRVFM